MNLAKVLNAQADLAAVQQKQAEQAQQEEEKRFIW